MQDHRLIPLEVLRDFARSQSEITSIRTCADELGLGRSTFHHFIIGKSTPHPRVRRVLGLWFLAKQDEAEDIDVVRPYVSALAILVATLPDGDREAARALLVESLAAIYAGRAERPRWLELLLTNAGRARLNREP
jgi:hypothetical protein